MLEIRVLRYFVAAVEARSVVRAAERLCVTQPTVSRALLDLEEALGQPLLKRERNALTVTERGALLYERAVQILELTTLTEAQLKGELTALKGTVSMALGECRAVSTLMRAFDRLRAQYPEISLDMVSGHDAVVTHALEQEQVDFGLLVGRSPVLHDYHALSLPVSDRWGILLNATHPLAVNPCLKRDEVASLPLIASRQALLHDELSGFFGASLTRLKVVATYNLMYNAAQLARTGAGAVLGIEGVVSVDENFKFLPLEPEVRAPCYLVWKKGLSLSPCATAYLDFLRGLMKDEEEESQAQSASSPSSAVSISRSPSAQSRK